MRAFTAKDRQDIKKVAENYPETNYYKTEDLITHLGIGEALVALLNEKGIPTPLVHSLLCPPASRMDVLTDSEINTIVSDSKLSKKYNQVIESESAYELLNEKIEEASKINDADDDATGKTTHKTEKGTLETILDSPVTRQVGRTAASILTRTLLGVLGLGGTTRRRKKTSWF